MARSELFNQIQANVLNRTVVRYANSEASSLGAVMSAMVTLGMEESHQTAFDRVNPPDLVSYTPDPEAYAIYSELTRRRRALYRALDEREVYQDFAAALG